MVENFKMKGISISKTTVQVKKKSGSQILVHRRPYTGIPGKYRGAAVYTAVYTAAFPGAAVYTGISPERHPTPTETREEGKRRGRRTKRLSPSEPVLRLIYTITRCVVMRVVKGAKKIVS